MLRTITVLILLVTVIVSHENYKVEIPIQCRIHPHLPYVCEGKRYRSDYTYFPDAGGWLKLNEVPSNWPEARLRCHLEGGKLASPLNKPISLAMKVLMERQGFRDCGVFTGIHAFFSRGDFSSMEGTPLARIPHDWAPGEPNNEGDSEQCLLMLPDMSLADVSCHQPFPYVCFKKQEPGQLLNACGTFDIGYTLDARTGSCYKFHTVPRTWSRAYMTCVAEGGHLVIINSEKEAQVVRDLFAKFPARLVPTKAPFGKDVFFMGFHDWNEHGEWLTIHGETLEQAGYAVFDAGKPNNVTGQFCGGVQRSGKLDDLWCENKYSFICEKAPDSLLWED